MMKEDEKESLLHNMEGGNSSSSGGGNSKKSEDRKAMILSSGIDGGGSSGKLEVDSTSAANAKAAKEDDIALKRMLMTWGSVLALLFLISIVLVIVFEAFIMAFIPLGCLHWLILQPQLDNILVGGWMNIMPNFLQQRYKKIIQGTCTAILHLDKDNIAISSTIGIGFINCLQLNPNIQPFLIEVIMMILMIIWGTISGAILIHVPLRKLHRTVKDWPNTQQLRARELLVLRCFAVVGCSLIGIVVTLSYDDFPAPVGTVVAMLIYLGLSCLAAVIRMGRYMHMQDWYRKVMMWDVSTPSSSTTTTSADPTNSNTVV